MDEIPDGANVSGPLCRARARFTHEPATALPQRVVEALDVIRFTALFAKRTKPRGRPACRSCVPKSGVPDRTVAIDHRKGGPELASGCFRAGSKRHAHHFTPPLHGQPHPALASFVADQRPECIPFQNQAPCFCSMTVTERGTAAQLALTSSCSQRADPHVTRPLPARETRSRRSVSIRRLVSSLMRRWGGRPSGDRTPCIARSACRYAGCRACYAAFPGSSGSAAV